jgi:dTDP-4-dehydrorhamnose reductase
MEPRPPTWTVKRTMRLLVTGAAGQLGSAIAARFLAAGHEVVPLTRDDLDVAVHDEVMEAVADHRPDVVVNCTAYNDVDGAEAQHAAALDVNAFAVRSLARAAQTFGVTLVHYSTDFVFDGAATAPYLETDRARPQSVYGCSKLLGEWFAQDAARHYVLRVESLFGGPAARSSIDRILDAQLEGREAPVFVDRHVSPTFVEDAVLATARLLDREAPPGLYHCVNSGYATWHAVAEEIARQAGVTPRLKPVKVEEVKLRAARPQFAALSNEKLRQAGIDMPAWQDAIGRYVRQRAARGPRQS